MPDCFGVQGEKSLRSQVFVLDELIIMMLAILCMWFHIQVAVLAKEQCMKQCFSISTCTQTNTILEWNSLKMLKAVHSIVCILEWLDFVDSVPLYQEDKVRNYHTRDLSFLAQTDCLVSNRCSLNRFLALLTPRLSNGCDEKSEKHCLRLNGFLSAFLM